MKRVLSLIMVAITIFSLTSCGSKDSDELSKYSKTELIEMVHEMEDTAIVMSDRIDSLEEMLKGVQGEEVKGSGITEFNDGTGRLTLNSIDSVVELPKPFEYPKSVQYYNNSSISLDDGITIKPSSNWIVSLSGTQINLQHNSSEIYGVITIGGFDKADRNKPAASDLNDSINEFFESMPPETISMSRIFVDSNWCGTNAKAHTFIDQEDAQIRCGFFGFGDLNITYWFAYKGLEDPSKDELIITLMQTMKIYKNNLRIE